MTPVAGGGSAWLLSGIVAALMAIQSATGVLVPALYRDIGWVTAAWYGNDLVTLLVAVPALTWALVAVRGGARRAELVWYSMLGYAIYNYGYYLFGAALNWFFPLYVALFAVPVFALILAIGRTDADTIADGFASRTPVKWIGGYMLFTGIGLAVAWIAQWATFMTSGTPPAIGEEAFRLIAAMDLSFMVPWFVVGAVLLMRRRSWGYVIAPIIVIKGATYTLVLATSSLVAGMRGIEGSFEQIPIWVAWTLAGGLAAWALLHSITERRERTGAGASSAPVRSLLPRG